MNNFVHLNNRRFQFIIHCPIFQAINTEFQTYKTSATLPAIYNIIIKYKKKRTRYPPQIRPP